MAQSIGGSAMRKAFWRILPLIGLAYLFAYMDRVNVSFAAASMNEALGFSATVYGLGAGMFFLGYVLFEIPLNLMMVSNAVLILLLRRQVRGYAALTVMNA